jgi:hypothetical protein
MGNQDGGSFARDLELLARVEALEKWHREMQDLERAIDLKLVRRQERERVAKRLAEYSKTLECTNLGWSPAIVEAVDMVRKIGDE